MLPLTASGERQREASTAELGSGLKPRAIGCNSYSRSRNVSRSFVVKAEHYWELKLFWSFFPILLVLLEVLVVVVLVLRKLQFWVVTPPPHADLKGISGVCLLRLSRPERYGKCGVR